MPLVLNLFDLHFPHYWPFVRGIHWLHLTKGWHCGASMFPYLLGSTCCWTNCWVAGDLRCHYAHVSSLWWVPSPVLTHWGRVTHVCVNKLPILGSDNGLSPGRRQAIIWTKDGILLIWPSETNFSEILIEIDTFSFKKMHLKMSSGKWRPFVSASMC